MRNSDFLYVGPRGAPFKALPGDRLTIEEVFNEHANRPTPQKANKRLDIYHRCVQIVGGSVAYMPWAIERVDAASDDPPAWINGDPVPNELAFLGNPTMYFWLAATSDALEGRAYIFKERVSRQGRVNGLRWMDPLTIDPVIDKDKGLVEFRRDTGEGPASTLSLKDVMYMFAPDPYTEVGPSEATDAESAKVSAEVLMNMGEFMTGYFDRGMIKATLLRVHDRASLTEVARVQKWWEKWITGVKNAFRNKIIQSGGIEPITIGEGLSDIADQDISEKMVKRILYAFGVPKELVDGSDQNSQAGQQAVISYMENVAIPRANRIAHMFNGQLLAERGYRIKFHPHKLEHFQQRELEKANQIMRLVGRPVLTVNEGRAMLEMNPIDGGDILQDFQLFTNPMGTDVPKQPNPARGPEVNEKEEEAAKWYRKVKNRGPDVPFECEYLSRDEQLEIRARMDSGMDLQKCFSPPFTPFM